MARSSKEILYILIKRLMDVFLALFLGFIFSPIFLLVMIAIKLDSEGPIFADVPPRVGKDGKLFYIYKFRSMIPNAYTLLKTDPKFKKAHEEQQKSGNYKIKHDPRVTRIGKTIRKYSIDEIPQLINVFKGEMSLVGPRPYYPEELVKQQKAYPQTKEIVRQALKVKPGITGLWQVSGRSEVSFDKRIALDAYYANKRSIWLDLLILLKSPWAMLSGKGAT